MRYTATKDPKIRAFPAGTIDPELKMISFWNGDKPVAVLTYYATHPQSYYRTGLANPDFPGLARNARQTETGVPHIHFNGAGGNLGAGKCNDGSHENRQVLADRVAAAMKLAWEDTEEDASRRRRRRLGRRAGRAAGRQASRRGRLGQGARGQGRRAGGKGLRDRGPALAATVPKGRHDRHRLSHA